MATLRKSLCQMSSDAASRAGTVQLSG
jgi:hypothetical protein